jgi:hypothetical protein
MTNQRRYGAAVVAFALTIFVAGALSSVPAVYHFHPDDEFVTRAQEVEFYAVIWALLALCSTAGFAIPTSTIMYVRRTMPWAVPIASTAGVVIGVFAFTGTLNALGRTFSVSLPYVGATAGVIVGAAATLLLLASALNRRAQ